MLRSLPGLALLLCLIAEPAAAGRGRKSKKDTSTSTPATQTPRAPTSQRTPRVPLFPDGLPLDLARAPAGLPSPSAQTCQGCHPSTGRQWRGSGHHVAPTLLHLQAAQAAEDARCLQCHQPFTQQQDRLTDGAGHWLDPNPAWSPTLAMEGITCATCHLRDGTILAADGEAGPAPHPIGISDMGVASCETCHEWQPAGHQVPMYDTVSSWRRSGWAEAGVDCVDCHLPGGSHELQADLDQALTALVRFPSPTVVRGGEPVTVELTMMNTGAGHHVPSGSPYTSLMARARLLGPSPQSEPTVLWEQPLGREYADDGSWSLVTDTRIAPGGTRSWSFPMGLSRKAAPGGRVLEIGLWRRHGIDEEAEPAWIQTYPLTVQ